MDERDRVRELCELSRHLDSLLWTVTSLWAGGIGGLLVYCTSTFQFYLALLGLLSLPAALLFAANFRRLRWHVHERMPKDVSSLYISQEPIKQWDIFLIVFLLLAGAWTWLGVSKNCIPGLWYILGLADCAILVVVWSYGKPERKDKKDSTTPPERSSDEPPQPMNGAGPAGGTSL